MPGLIPKRRAITSLVFTSDQSEQNFAFMWRQFGNMCPHEARRFLIVHRVLYTSQG